MSGYRKTSYVEMAKGLANSGTEKWTMDTTLTVSPHPSPPRVTTSVRLHAQREIDGVFAGVCVADKGQLRGRQKSRAQIITKHRMIVGDQHAQLIRPGGDENRK